MASRPASPLSRPSTAFHSSVPKVGGVAALPSPHIGYLLEGDRRNRTVGPRKVSAVAVYSPPLRAGGTSGEEKTRDEDTLLVAVGYHEGGGRIDLYDLSDLEEKDARSSELQRLPDVLFSRPIYSPSLELFVDYDGNVENDVSGLAFCSAALPSLLSSTSNAFPVFSKEEEEGEEGREMPKRQKSIKDNPRRLRGSMTSRSEFLEEEDRPATRFEAHNQHFGPDLEAPSKTAEKVERFRRRAARFPPFLLSLHPLSKTLRLWSLEGLCLATAPLPHLVDSIKLLPSPRYAALFCSSEKVKCFNFSVLDCWNLKVKCSVPLPGGVKSDLQVEEGPLRMKRASSVKPSLPYLEGLASTLLASKNLFFHEKIAVSVVCASESDYFLVRVEFSEVPGHLKGSDVMPGDDICFESSPKISKLVVSAPPDGVRPALLVLNEVYYVILGNKISTFSSRNSKLERIADIRGADSRIRVIGGASMGGWVGHPVHRDRLSFYRGSEDGESEEETGLQHREKEPRIIFWDSEGVLYRLSNGDLEDANGNLSRGFASSKSGYFGAYSMFLPLRRSYFLGFDFYHSDSSEFLASSLVAPKVFNFAGVCQGFDKKSKSVLDESEEKSPRMDIYGCLNLGGLGPPQPSCLVDSQAAARPCAPVLLTVKKVETLARSSENDDYFPRDRYFLKATVFHASKCTHTQLALPPGVATPSCLLGVPGYALVGTEAGFVEVVSVHPKGGIRLLKSLEVSPWTEIVVLRRVSHSSSCFPPSEKKQASGSQGEQRKYFYELLVAALDATNCISVIDVEKGSEMIRCRPAFLEFAQILKYRNYDAKSYFLSVSADKYDVKISYWDGIACKFFQDFWHIKSGLHDHSTCVDVEGPPSRPVPADSSTICQIDAWTLLDAGKSVCRMVQRPGALLGEEKEELELERKTFMRQEFQEVSEIKSKKFGHLAREDSTEKRFFEDFGRAYDVSPQAPSPLPFLEADVRSSLLLSEIEQEGTFALVRTGGGVGIRRCKMRRNTGKGSHLSVPVDYSCSLGLRRLPSSFQMRGALSREKGEAVKKGRERMRKGTSDSWCSSVAPPSSLHSWYDVGEGEGERRNSITGEWRKMRQGRASSEPPKGVINQAMQTQTQQKSSQSSIFFYSSLQSTFHLLHETLRPTRSQSKPTRESTTPGLLEATWGGGTPSSKHLPLQVPLRDGGDEDKSSLTLLSELLASPSDTLDMEQRDLVLALLVRAVRVACHKELSQWIWVFSQCAASAQNAARMGLFMFSNAHYIKVKSAFLCGVIASEAPWVFPRSIELCAALVEELTSVGLEARNEEAPYQSYSALSILARCFPSVFFAVKAHGIDHLLAQLARGTTKPHLHSPSSSILVQIASLNTKACIESLSPSRLYYPHSNPDDAVGGLCSLLAILQHHPKALFPFLETFVLNILKCLDPASPALKKASLGATTKIIQELKDTYPMLDFHQPSQLLALGTLQGSIIVFDLRTATKKRVLIGHLDKVTALAFEPEGDRLASYSSGEACFKLWLISSPSFLGGLLGISEKCLLSKKLGEAKRMVPPMEEVNGVREEEWELVKVKWINSREVLVTRENKVGELLQV